MIGLRKVGYTQIAEILGVSRTHVVDRISKQPDFPKPIIRVSRQTVWWDERDIWEWARKRAQKG